MKLKLFISSIALIAGAVSVAKADDGYAFTWNNMDPNQHAFLLIGNGGGNAMLAVKDAAISLNVTEWKTLAPSNTNLGVYTFDSNGNITSNNLFSSVALGDTYSVNVSSGEYVSFYVESYGTVADAYLGNNYYGNLNSPDSFSLYFNTADWSSFNWDFWNITINATGTAASTPSGQPLPGVFLSLLVAGAAVPFFRKKLKIS